MENKITREETQRNEGFQNNASTPFLSSFRKEMMRMECSWCEEERDVLFNWNEIMSDGELHTDIVCNKCISLMFEEDPTSLTKIELVKVES